MSDFDLSPYQILCLEHEDTSLYGEVIQIIVERKLCWLRPLALLRREPQDPENIETFYDLRQSADLLYPVSLFRVAIDTEVLPILTRLERPKNGQNPIAALEDDQMMHQQLHSFIRQIWRARPEAFQR
ncbi:MAG TPA: hypothetical protein V6C65_37980 [Allocoleopsis sp.]